MNLLNEMLRTAPTDRCDACIYGWNEACVAAGGNVQTLWILNRGWRISVSKSAAESGWLKK